jgi:hypothetical protein
MNKCLERVNGRHFWNPEVFSYAMIPRCCPNSRVLFVIVASIVYDWIRLHFLKCCPGNSVNSGSIFPFFGTLY